MNWLKDLWDEIQATRHTLHEIKRTQDHVLEKLSQVLKEEDRIMSTEEDLASAITDLSAALTANTAEIEKLLTKITTPGISQAAVQSAVDQIRSLVKATNDEVTKAQAQVP